MNHCIPDRKLRPIGAQINQGFVVSSPMPGNVTHYVFRDKETKLFIMAADLFKCRDSSLKTTEVIRREQMLEFGDHINFTADEKTYRIIDFEKSMPIHETDCIGDDYLVKTICVLPSMEEKQPMRLWTTTFGDVNLAEREVANLHSLAAHNIPLNCWVKIKIAGDRLAVGFYEMHSIAVDDRQIAWDTTWNYEKKPTTGLTWDITDSEDSDSEEKLIEKSDQQDLDVRIKLEGVLIGQKEIYCPALKDHRVFVGLWDASDCKVLPLGYLLKFDAFYSDIRQQYIAYHYEATDDEICEVYLNDFERPTITTFIYFPDTDGGFYSTNYFGLIADPYRHLGTLPYVYVRMEEADEVPVNIVDNGPNKLARFVVEEELPRETRDKVAEANGLVEDNSEMSIASEGFIVNSYTGRLFSPEFPMLRFDFPAEYRSEFPVGSWTNFKAVYSTEENLHKITEAQLIWEKPPIPHSRLEKRKPLDDGRTKTFVKYKFKIDVELVDNQRDVLYNSDFGYVTDPANKFTKRPRIKKYEVIVKEDTSASTLTLFKLKRMAVQNEKMQSQQKNKKNGHIVDEDEQFEDGLELCGLELDDKLCGLDLADVIDDWKPKPSQVDFNSEFSIRERKLEATRRKRERKKREKEELERRKELEERKFQEDAEN